MSLFGLLLIIALIYLVVVPLWNIYSAVSRQRRAMRDIFERAASASSGSGRGPSSSSRQERPVQKKKIDPTVGEYVEFEEIETTTTVADEQSTTTTYTRESQVTDVEWEDIK